MLAAGINAEENRGKLKETMKLFETSLNALMNGDAAMNIPACEFPEISEQLEKVQTFYNEMDAVFDKAVEGESRITLICSRLLRPAFRF